MRLLQLVILLACAFTATCLKAQIVSGIITDADGAALPYATVGVVNAALGATAGEAGDYSLELSGLTGDSATLAFRYIGLAEHRQRVPIRSDVRVDVQLQAASYTLAEATVGADAEDPAYHIMREAAARRLGYLRADEHYEVDVYVKGQVKIITAPERIMGQDIGDMGGLLDSARGGIVYLSESYSTVAFEQPDKFRETVTASKVSGDPRGYSFNSAAGVDFDLYRRITEYGKPILTPLAQNAPQTYRFTLLGSRRTNDDQLIHRIAIAPRGNDLVPAYNGELYIEEGSFHVVDADLYLLGKALNAPGLDTLYIAQSYRRAPSRPPSNPTTNKPNNQQQKPAAWRVLQRRVEPALSLFGFVFRGAFTAVYSDYDYAPSWSAADYKGPDPFGRVVTEVLAEANQVDSNFFTARPIPLTRAEQQDYVRKDSIRMVRDDPVYRDSVQTSRNKFGFGALAGYTYSDWRTRQMFSFLSPLSQNGFNAVTGLRLGVGLAYTKRSERPADDRFSAGVQLGYGFADKRLYPTASVGCRWAGRYLKELEFEGGRELTDYHRLQPVSETVNTLYSLLAKRNPLRLYERRFVAATHRTDLHAAGQPPLASLSHTLVLERRLPRANSSDYSLRQKDRSYAPNRPELDGRSGIDSLSDRTMIRYQGSITHTPGRKYTARPDAFIATEEGGATLELNWRYGRQLSELGPQEGADKIHYAFVGFGVRIDERRLGRAGNFSARLAGGAPLFYSGSREVPDLQLFAGSELWLNSYDDYLMRYLALPHYGLAMDGGWAEVVVEHHFNGALWRRLALLRRLGWEVVGRAASIAAFERSEVYAEAGFGIENIGFGPARFIRADVTWPYKLAIGAGAPDPGWGGAVYRVGLNVPLDLVVGE